LYDSDLEYHVENNRRYVPNYFMPNDEDEQLRMQIIHQVYLFMFDSQLTTVPLENPKKILDIGTGTGEWAIAMGEAFPDAEVIGMDLSAIQPSAVPHNVFFEIFDAEDDDDWTYPEDYFDLIHFRNMTGSFRSWEKMYERAYKHLKPGGYIEVVDFDEQSNSFVNYFPKDSEVHAWFMALGEATMRSGKDINPAHLQPEKIVDVGFVDVEVSGHDLPMGSWPNDPDVRSTAKLWLVACLAGFEAISLRPLTQALGWSADEVRRMCSIVEQELKAVALNKEKAAGLSCSVKIVVGRKPESSSESRSAYGLEVDEELPNGKRTKLEDSNANSRPASMKSLGSITTRKDMGSQADKRGSVQTIHGLESLYGKNGVLRPPSVRSNGETKL
jgi:SAM-dependent methyltransferase